MVFSLFIDILIIYPIQMGWVWGGGWLAEKGFRGDGKPPKLTDKLRVEAAARYMEVVESFTEEPMQLEVGPVDESIYSILNPFAY